jgi:hypothetical protein
MLYKPPIYNISNISDILGPNIYTIDYYCKFQLPYYEFRLKTMLDREHRYECDKNIIRRKPKGIYTHSLDLLIKYNNENKNNKLDGLLP